MLSLGFALTMKVNRKVQTQTHVQCTHAQTQTHINKIKYELNIKFILRHGNSKHFIIE